MLVLWLPFLFNDLLHFRNDSASDKMVFVESGNLASREFLDKHDDLYWKNKAVLFEAILGMSYRSYQFLFMLMSWKLLKRIFSQKFALFD